VSVADYHDEISDDNRCWEKIFSQTRETADFRFKMESLLSSFMDDWFYRKDAPLPKTPIHSSPNLFMLGLAQAGLLGGLHRDYVKSDALALEYLEEAATLDPTNSAPMIYAAIVAARLGLTSRSELYYRLALDRGKRFDSYVKKFANKVYSTVDNADDYLAAATILATVPIPEYTDLKPYLKAPGGKKFAIQMLQDGLAMKEPVDLVDYIPIEYAIGRSALGDDPKYPTLKQIWDRHPASAESDEITMALRENCEISSLEPAVAKLKERLKRQYQQD
jgi:hypothetical protein